MPEELLLHVVELATRGVSSQSVLRYVLVDRRFARVAAPLLYRDVVLDITNHGAPRVWFLIKTLLPDSGKRSYIQSLTLKGSFNVAARPREFYTEAKPLQALSHLVRGQVQHMIDRTITGEAKEDIKRRTLWQEECLNKESPIYLLTLLLPRLPSLDRLSVQDTTLGSWRVIEESALKFTECSKVIGKPLPFRALETIHIGSTS